MRTITVVGAHAGGEIGNVVVGGVLPPAGRDGVRADAGARARRRRAAAAAAARAARQRRRAREPDRAGRRATTATPASSSWSRPSIRRCRARTRSAPTTVLLETGMVTMHEPETVVRLEAPGGVVEARATLPRRALRVGRVHQRARASPSGSTHRSRSRGSARSASTSPTAACSTRSPTPRRWASRSSPARRASSRSRASASARQRASS